MCTLSASQRQHLLPGAGAKSDAVSDGRSLQRPQRARRLAVDVPLGQVGLTHVLVQHTSKAMESVTKLVGWVVSNRVMFTVSGTARRVHGAQPLPAQEAQPLTAAG